MKKCVNCKGEVFVDSVKYPGAGECSECGFLVQKGMINKIINVILPDDPMDAMMCESCQ